MAEPATADQFLDLAGKSGLLDAQHIGAYLQCLRSAGPQVADSPAAMADAMVHDHLLTRFQAEQLMRGRWRNFILAGKYKILGPLGAGGMGYVYLCEHLVMRRRVAVKVLPTQRSTDVAALERFRREARAVAQLHHPNIVGGHDIDQDGNVHFLVMEYIDGSTFHAIIKERGPLTVSRAAHYIRQTALGLQHAHEAGLVHRDIKPSNLLLDRTGTVKILDLGLARFFHDEADDLSRRHVESPVGTSDFMSPEQARDSHVVDIRTDIYSLGATFYFLLAGHGPFREGTALQKLVRHQIERPTPIRELRPEVPEGLAAVMERMMAKEPADRYQTPAEVAEALAPWTQSPIAPPPPEEMPQLARAARAAKDAGAGTGVPVSLYGPTSSVTRPAGLAAGTPASPGLSPTDPEPVRRAGDARGKPQRGGTRPKAAPSPPPFTPVDSQVVVAVTPPPSAASSETSSAAWVRRYRGLLLATAAVVLLGAGILVARLLPTGGSSTGAPPIVPSTPATMRLLVPAYFYPSGEGLAQWDKLLDSPAAASIVAIVNPNSGPGKVVDPNYAKIVERAKSKGLTLLGYVSTKFAARPLADVKADVDQWAHFYPGIQGIFFDQQASAAEEVLYYEALYDYVHKEWRLPLVVSDPGTVCSEEYVAKPTADIICPVEGAKDFTSYRRPPWTDRYLPERFAALLYGVGTRTQMQRDLRALREQRIGYCYITDGKEPNPWERLPAYWDAEVEAVMQMNAAR
jgi:serine/threonine protein kinase